MNEKQRGEIIKSVIKNMDLIETNLNNYLRENILTQIDGLSSNDLNALSQAQRTFYTMMTGETP